MDPAALQSDLSDYYGGLPKENPGSLWPKTSLAAVKDNKRLTPEQLRTLISICWCASPLRISRDAYFSIIVSSWTVCLFLYR